MDTIKSDNGVVEHWQDYASRVGFVSRHRSSDSHMCVLCGGDDTIADSQEVTPTEETHVELSKPSTSSEPETTEEEVEAYEHPDVRQNSETNTSAVEEPTVGQLQPSTTEKRDD